MRSRPARRRSALTLPLPLHKSIQGCLCIEPWEPAEVVMSFRVSGKNLDVGEALRERINSRIGEAMSKYFDGGYSGHVTVAREDSGFRTECAVHLDSKITLRAEASAPDAYASAHQAALRVEKQLRRYHRRLKDHRC
jgi:ribosomal subunit interface protein